MPEVGWAAGSQLSIIAMISTSMRKSGLDKAVTPISVLGDIGRIFINKPHQYA